MISPYFNLSGSDARGLLYGLMETDKIQLRENPHLPSMRQLVQDGRVRYKRADPQEHWQSYKEIVEQTKFGGTGYADCEDLASAIAAEDQVRYGVKSIPYAYAPREGLFHVVTAVPADQFGGIPRQHWPDAKGAPPIAGYVLQDPSAAAGMGSFGGLPGKEVPVHNSYGALPAPPSRRRRRGPGLGGVLSALKKGLIGEEKAVQAAFDIGTGAREGIGVQKGWAAELGRTLGGRFGPGPAAPSPADQEAAAVAALQKGAAAEEGALAAADEDEDIDLGLEDEEFGFFGRMWFEDDPDLEFDDDEFDDEEFGFEREDWTGSQSWQVDALATRVADDIFGADDEDDDEFGALDDDEGAYQMGIFHESIDDFHDDLHEDLGPRQRFGDRFTPPAHMRPPPHMRGPIDAPMASYGEEGDDDEYGLLGIAIGKKARSKKQHRRISRQMPKIEQAVEQGNERKAARLAKRVYNEVKKLQKLGQRPLAGNKRLFAVYNFARGKTDFEHLSNRLSQLGSFGFMPRDVLFGQIEDELDEEMGFDDDLFGLDDDDLFGLDEDLL